MSTRKANAVWNGTIKEGKGTMKMESGAYEGAYSFGSRFEDDKGTNPEELIGAAHAGCYSMALSLEIGEAGYTPESIETDAEVDFGVGDNGPEISNIRLTVSANIPDITEDEFQELAEGAKNGCPVSKALAGVDITLAEANLNS